MGGFFLLGLLGVGALIGLIDFLDDDSTATPSTPGTGSDAQDPTLGTSGSDEILAIATGEDIEARAGDDTVTGAAGDDSLSGQTGADVLTGAAGDDLLFGGAGSDTIDGGADDDIISGGANDDFLRGGAGNDIMSGDNGADTLGGGLGDDVIFGTETAIGATNAGDFAALLAENPADPIGATYFPAAGSDDSDVADTLDGGYGDDVLVLGSSDIAEGGAGDDLFNIGDWITAGNSATLSDYTAGEDQIVYSFDFAAGAPDTVTVTDDGAGNALITVDGQVVATVTGAAATLSSDDIVLLSRSDTATDGTIAVGSSADDSFELSANNDTASLGAGDDFASTLAGDDTVDGETGNDTLLGGAGNDNLRGGSDDDVLVDGAGSDVLRGGLGEDLLVAGNYFDTSALEAGDTPDLATANFADASDTAADTLEGGFGSDTLLFGAGDMVSGGAFADAFYSTDAGLGAAPSTITDFDLSEDTLVVSMTSANAANVSVSYSAGATATTGDAIVSVGDTNLMVLEGVGTSFTAANISIATRAA